MHSKQKTNILQDKSQSAKPSVRNRQTCADKENEPEDGIRRSKRYQTNSRVVKDKTQLRPRQTIPEAEKIQQRKVKVRAQKHISDGETDFQSPDVRDIPQEQVINSDDTEASNDMHDQFLSSEFEDPSEAEEPQRCQHRNKFREQVNKDSGPEFTTGDAIMPRHLSTVSGITAGNHITGIPLSHVPTMPLHILEQSDNMEEDEDTNNEMDADADEQSEHVQTHPKKRKRAISNPMSNLSQEDVELEPKSISIDEDNETENTQKCVTKKPRQRGKLADFKDVDVCKAIKRASVEYMVRICTVSAFPDDEEQEFFARECWENACGYRNIRYPFTDHIKGIITCNASTIRGRVKDVAVASVASYFHFRRSTQPDDIQFNKDLAADLLKDDGFAYKDRERDIGLYENEIIAAVVLMQWFKNKKSDGIVFGASFNPISFATIALVLTAIEYAISQWSSGIYKRIADFSEAQVSEVYHRHLEALDAWRDFSDISAQSLARRQQELYTLGRANAGFPISEPVAILTNSQNSYKSRFQRATKALERINGD